MSDQSQPRYSMSDDQLKDRARNHLRNTDPGRLRQLARNGELDEYLQSRADAAVRYAENLIESGTFLE